MMDLFRNYELQREELLARIAQSLQLDNTRRKRMEDAYSSISTLLNEDEDFFKGIDIDVYAHGSTGIGTTCKPLNSSEFDLDIVVHIKSPYYLYKAEDIYNALYKKISDDGRYKDKVEKKKRCVRINYTGDFHMDILPGCVVFSYDEQTIKVPDRELKNWVTSSPKGYSEWFLTKSNNVVQPILEGYYKDLIKNRAEVQDLPEDDFYTKKPLQRSVQLVKRYRDIFFEKNTDYATSSIVLTTLMGQFYQGENSIYSTIENVVGKIKSAYANAINAKMRFKVLNPVNGEEDFTDKWTDKHYTFFNDFIIDFYTKWTALKQGFEISGQEYIKLFGEGIYKQSLQDQIKKLSKYSQDPTTVANGLIISGNAFTNNKGQINTSNGQKNEYHRNFGG